MIKSASYIDAQKLVTTIEYTSLRKCILCTQSWHD
ncbi:unnamed protein product [Spirodela intermedia]|uniref:Uncharacterized protein n=2 Tax=Spirodela intermedia TaxID=51605 RepID=A0A7I8JHI2_SPIIN|nr:unnamed protein product [Spirodela intermedia]CAA6669598.1 unnamed protein product [Spirodela intermedia]CAA7406564.1 unnamed protein product [Spirodela intermedia]